MPQRCRLTGCRPLMGRFLGACPHGAGPCCCAVRRATLVLMSRPCGQPSLTQSGQAGAASGVDDSGPFPCPGIAGWFSSRVREQARLTNWPVFRSLRCASLPAHRSDRHPGHPPRPMPRAAEPGCMKCSQRLDRRCSGCCGRLRCAAPPARGGSACARASHRAPPTAPPSTGEGDLWGDLQAVGRGTGSLLC